MTVAFYVGQRVQHRVSLAKGTITGILDPPPKVEAEVRWDGAPHSVLYMAHTLKPVDLVEQIGSLGADPGPPG